MKTFDPAQVLCIFAGIPIEGYADGTFINAERRKEMYNLTVGASGTGARAKTNDRSGTITFTLLQTSKANDALSAVALLDELSNDGVGPLLIQDLNGTTLIAAQSAWIQKRASVEMSNEITNREWVIESDDMTMFVGGNND